MSKQIGTYSLYEYKWSGFFKYEEGHWWYDNKEDWKVKPAGSKTDVKLTKRFSEVKGYEKKIKKELKTKDAFFAGNYKDNDKKDFYSWIASDIEAPVTGALSQCLNNFSHGTGKIQYELLSTIVKQNIIVKITNKSKRTTTWFYYNSKNYICSDSLFEYICVFPKIFFDIKSGKSVTATNIDNLKSHRILQQLTFNRTRDDKVNFINKGKIIAYPKGLACGCLPIPGKDNKKVIVHNKKYIEEPFVVKTPEIVVESPNVVTALEYLSQVWQDRYAKTILISAPPGSGKEQFSKSIPYGNGRAIKENDIKTLSLACNDITYLETMLYGEKSKRGKLVKGLIKQAKDKVVFLDEAHYPDGKNEYGIRSSLLRPLESDTYNPIGKVSPTDEPQKIENVQFIFATSKPFKGSKNIMGLSDLKPIDFWTRMTHVLTIKHPFEGVWDKLPEIVVSYFKFFWWERVENYFKVDPQFHLPIVTDKNKKEISTIQNGKKICIDKVQELIGFNTKPNKYIDKIASRFQEALLFIFREERIQPHELSIRGFRNMVTRLFSICAEKAMQGKVFDPISDGKTIESIIYEILEISRLDS